MSSNLERDEQIRQQLLERLEAAHRRYREYRAQENAALSLREDLGYTNPDGQFGVRKVIEAQNSAFEAYRQVLQEWTSFILEGKIPGWALQDPER